MLQRAREASTHHEQGRGLAQQHNRAGSPPSLLLTGVEAGFYPVSLPLR